MSDFQTPPAFNTPVPPQQQTQAPAAPQAAPAAPQASPQAAPQAITAPVEDKKKPAPRLTPDHIKFILANVTTMSYQEMAKQLGITKNQVNRTLQDVKGGVKKSKDGTEEYYGLRGEAIKAAKQGGQEAYAAKMKKDGTPAGSYDWAQPLTDMAKKVEAKIEAKLSRPAETRVGGSQGGGVVANAISSEVSSLLDSL